MTVLLIGIIIYSIIALAALRPLTGHFAYGFLRRHNQRYSFLRYSEPNGDQWFGAFCLALCIVCAWPLAIVWNAVGGRWQIGAEREHVIEQQRNRLKQLERELDLR